MLIVLDTKKLWVIVLELIVSEDVEIRVFCLNNICNEGFGT